MILILNGPAGCGKDTIGKELVSRYGLIQAEFKDALRQEVIRHFELTDEEAHSFLEDANHRVRKESPSPDLDGLSPREAMILVSEKIIKPAFGKDFFGIKAAETLMKQPDEDFVFTDGGFIEEVRHLESNLEDDIVVVRLHRDGFTFEGDSRSYIDQDDIVSPVVDVHLEDGNIDKAVDDVVEAVAKELN